MKKILIQLFAVIGIVLLVSLAGSILGIIWDDNHKILYIRILATSTLLLIFWFIVFSIIEVKET